MQLRELSDREELRELVHAYCRGVDRGAVDEVAALFTNDAVFRTSTGRHGTATGRDAIRARLALLLSTFDATSHHVSNTTFAFSDPGTATLETYLYAWHRFPGERPDGYLWGRYADVAVRTGAGWRLRERTLLVVGEVGFPFGWIPYRNS